MPYAYHQPSLARITDGSAKVSANVVETGLTYAVRVTASVAAAAVWVEIDELSALTGAEGLSVAAADEVDPKPSTNVTARIPARIC